MQVAEKKTFNGMIAINGMGRIGRTLLRILIQQGNLEQVLAVNDIMPKENLIYLLKYDSIRGPLFENIIATERGFKINNHEIRYSQSSDIKSIAWHSLAIDTVVEATGLFTHSSEASVHLSKGAKRVLLTTYGKDLPTTVWGVNHQLVNSNLISPGDCTINCTAPLINIIKQKWNVQSLHINVIQGYTTRQELIDSPYKGHRRGRAAGHSIIPFEVNIKPVLEEIFPDLRGNIESMTTRVPVPCGALADISFVLKTQADAQAVNTIIEQAAATDLKSIVSITYDPIVSSDILHNPHSGVVDGSLTKVSGGHQLKLMVWFDNEWGYSNRLVDWLCSF